MAGGKMRMLDIIVRPVKLTLRKNRILPVNFTVLIIYRIFSFFFHLLFFGKIIDHRFF